MVLVSWFILLQLKFVQVDKCVISASASARGGSMEMYLLLAQKSMHHTFGNHGKRWKPSKENRLLILPTYKPLIFRNTFRCTDDQSSIKVNEGHKQCCVTMVLCLVKHVVEKDGSRWHEIWIFTTCSRTGGLDELDKQTDSLLSTIWWSKFVDV